MYKIKTPKMNLNYCFKKGYVPIIACFVLLVSCKKKDSSPPNEDLCVTVKDYYTHEPVENAHISVAFKEDLTQQSQGWMQYGYTDATGNGCVDGGGFKYIASLTVEKNGYETNCPWVFAPLKAPQQFEIFLYKRNGFVKVHAINVPPIYVQDELFININYNNDGCTGLTELKIPAGSPPDTEFVQSLVAGENNFGWQLMRNDSNITLSSFTISVVEADTTNVEINY